MIAYVLHLAKLSATLTLLGLLCLLMVRLISEIGRQLFEEDNEGDD